MTAKGGFSDTPLDVIMIVVTRYELYALKQIVAEVDPKSFTNIVATESVVGSFWSQEQQKQAKSNK